MKLSACIVSRNDNYGGNLIERSTYCLNSMIDTFDEVFYVDWNSPPEVGSLLNVIKPNLGLKGNLKHIVITPEVASILTNNDEHAAKCCEVLGRNIGLKRATGDYLVSTNIDIIAPRRDLLEEVITSGRINDKTLYTISRRHTDLKTINEIAQFSSTLYPPQLMKIVRDKLTATTEERHFDEKIVTGDDYSLINCCGDFQIAHKDIWAAIKGFEEELIYTLYSDTNLQKKALMHGYDLKALYSPALFHIDHGPGGGGFMTGINKKTNDMHRAVTFQHETQNEDTWGFSNIEIEYEVL